MQGNEEFQAVIDEINKIARNISTIDREQNSSEYNTCVNKIKNLYANLYSKKLIEGSKAIDKSDFVKASRAYDPIAFFEKLNSCLKNYKAENGDFNNYFMRSYKIIGNHAIGEYITANIRGGVKTDKKLNSLWKFIKNYIISNSIELSKITDEQILDIAEGLGKDFIEVKEGIIFGFNNAVASTEQDDEEGTGKKQPDNEDENARKAFEKIYENKANPFEDFIKAIDSMLKKAAKAESLYIKCFFTLYLLKAEDAISYIPKCYLDLDILEMFLQGSSSKELQSKQIAQYLNVSEPAVSKQLKNFKQKLDIELKDIKKEMNN